MSVARQGKGDSARGSGTGPRRGGASDRLALKITRARMAAAIRAGDAIPLELAGGWLARYQDGWWVRSEIGWIRITDEATIADIDHVATRLAEVADDAAGTPDP